MDTMFKGAPKGKTEYVINDIQNVVADLEERGRLINSLAKKDLGRTEHNSKAVRGAQEHRECPKSSS